MAYSDKARAQAIKLVEANDGVIDKRTLSDIRVLLKNPTLPFKTVQRWCDGKKASDEKRIEVDRYDTDPLPVLLEGVARTHIRHADSAQAVERINAQQAMTSAAIAIDKMRLLQGLPTEIIDTLPQLTKLIELIKSRGWKASEVFEDLFRQYAEAENADAEV